MSGLEILSIAPSATLQDRGRSGYLRYGVTSSGAMDEYALAEGQVLLGNNTEVAALEFAEYGGRFRATLPMTVSTSGAEMELSVNGNAVAWRRSLRLDKSDVLDIGAATDGVYGYLHLEGGIEAQSILGSRSTHLRAGFALKPVAGQVLYEGEPGADAAPQGLSRPDYFDRRTLRVLWGPQSKYFSEEQKDQFVSAQFEVTKMRDRMGIQIKPSSGPVKSEDGLTIASDVTCLGDIQITGDGTPAILMADRGSSGGYPRIATLISADIPALAQIPTGESFSIEVIGRDQAVHLLGEHRSAISKLVSQTVPLVRDPQDIADLLAYNLIDGMLRGDEYDEN